MYKNDFGSSQQRLIKFFNPKKVYPLFSSIYSYSVLKDFFFCEGKVFKEANDPLDWVFVECDQDDKNIDSKIAQNFHKNPQNDKKKIKFNNFAVIRTHSHASYSKFP